MDTLLPEASFEGVVIGSERFLLPNGTRRSYGPTPKTRSSNRSSQKPSSKHLKHFLESQCNSTGPLCPLSSLLRVSMFNLLGVFVSSLSTPLCTLTISMRRHSNKAWKLQQIH